MNLATELLYSILSYVEGDQPTLVQLSRVSRSWNKAATVYLYKQPSIHLYSQLLALARAPHLHLIKTLNMQMIPHRWRLNMGDALLPILAHAINITDLDLALCNQLHMTRIQEATIHLPLESLSLHGLGHQVTDAIIDRWVTDHPYLLKLDVSACQITDESIYTIAAHCLQLEHLDVSACEAISEDGILHLTRRCAHIRYINIKDCFNVVPQEDGELDHALFDNDDDGWETE